MVHILWKIKGDLGLVDLGNNFFLVKLSNPKDRDYIFFLFTWVSGPACAHHD
jgi:hypothetical protein